MVPPRLKPPSGRREGNDIDEDRIGSESLNAFDVLRAAHSGDVAAEALADPYPDRADAATRPDDQRCAACTEPAKVTQRLQARHRDGRGRVTYSANAPWVWEGEYARWPHTAAPSSRSVTP